MTLCEAVHGGVTMIADNIVGNLTKFKCLGISPVGGMRGMSALGFETYNGNRFSNFETMTRTLMLQ